MVAHSALTPAGTDAATIASLWWAFVAISAVVYVAVIAALIVAIRRAARGTTAGPEAQARSDRRARTAVGAAVGATVVVLLAMLAGDFVLGRQVLGENSPAGTPVNIRIKGHQYWWEIVYEPDDPAKRLTTANEITVPVGRPVQLTLESQDVIHSFWLPALAGKKDLIPGIINTLRFSATEAGRFEGQCAEFCGYQHANMRTALNAVSQDAFDTWLAHERAPAAEPATDELRHGRDVFLGTSCIVCHTIRGTPAGATTGPDLTHFASRRQIAASAYPNRPDWLTAWISAPQRLKPGTNMPGTKLSPQDLSAIVAYLGSLK